MYERRTFLTVVSACATVSLAGCAEDESSPEQPDSDSEPEPDSSTEQPDSDSEPETESEMENDSRSELGPIEVTERFFAAINSGTETEISKLSHPDVRDVLVERYSDRYSERENLELQTIEQVSEREATTGEQSAPEVDIDGVEELLASDMATEVQWVLVTFSETEGDFYIPILKYDGTWFYYEHG
jgi:hypothetical protein